MKNFLADLLLTAYLAIDKYEGLWRLRMLFGHIKGVSPQHAHPAIVPKIPQHIMPAMNQRKETESINEIHT